MANLTDEDAYQYSEQHICYELDMLQWSTIALLKIIPDTNGTDPNLIFCKNALLETFAIHSRNLIDFLYPPEKVHKTDVTIRNYVDEKGHQQIQKRNDLLEEAKTKANKQVAHLTTDRITYEKEGKGWCFLNIYNAIIDQFISYKPYFISSRLSPLVIEKLVIIYIQSI